MRPLVLSMLVIAVGCGGKDALPKLLELQAPGPIGKVLDVCCEPGTSLVEVARFPKIKGAYGPSGDGGRVLPRLVARDRPHKDR